MTQTQKQNLDSRILASKTRTREQLVQEESKIRFERTVQKYNSTTVRIAEIEEKISRLQKERENLLRKQETRLAFLKEQKEER
jgi:uncharacterized protein YdcH (DUF465 family)